MGLVSWGNTETSKVPGSEWMCPGTNVTKLVALERAGKTVTDEDIATLAKGHPQHLQLIQYPQGYSALRVVDSRTGKPTYHTEHSYWYRGKGECQSGPKQPVTIGRNRLIDHMHNDGKGTWSRTRPAGANEMSPEALICPEERALDLRAELGIKALRAGSCILELREEGGHSHATLTVRGNKNRHRVDELTMYVESDGETTISAEKGNYTWLGGEAKAAIDSIDLYATQGAINDPEKQTLVLQGLAKLFGLNKWQRGLDLPRTASRLYSELGGKNLETSSILIPR